MTTFNQPTGKVALAPLVSELDPDHAIGTYFRNVDCWVFVRPTVPRDLPGVGRLTEEVRDTLKGSKLTILAPGAADADFVLTGTIPEAHADLCIDNVFNEGPADIDAQVTISWQLLSARDKQVLFQTTTSGSGRAIDPNERVDTGVIAAIDEAAKQLLQTAAFQQYVTFGHVVVPTPAAVASGFVPPGGQAPIPVPPAGIPRPETTFSAILVPVKAARPDTATLDHAAARAATVLVAPVTGASGAGIVLGDGYVLTTASLVGDAASVVVTVAPGKTEEGRLVRKDAALDIALLKVAAALPAPLPLHPRRVAVGDKVFGVGAGGVVAGAVTETRASGGRDTVKFDGAAEAGGPVLDASGNVIGLLQAGGTYASIGTVFRTLGLGAQLSDE
jgi:hypothetical protein